MSHASNGTWTQSETDAQPFGQPDARQAALRSLAGSLTPSALGRRLPRTLELSIMAQYDDKLTAISAQLKKGIAPASETVRSFLLWFGSERRGFRVVRRVRFQLKKYGLVTTPDFEYAYIDGTISFKLATAEGAASEYEGGTVIADPTYRIGRLESANPRRPPKFPQ